MAQLCPSGRRAIISIFRDSEKERPGLAKSGTPSGRRVVIWLTDNAERTDGANGFQQRAKPHCPYGKRGDSQSRRIRNSCHAVTASQCCGDGVGSASDGL